MTEATFVRVFQLPEKLSNGFAFGGGVDITFRNVDWFQAPIDLPRAGLIAFIREKNYYYPYHRYIVIIDHPSEAFMIDEKNQPNPDEEPRRDLSIKLYQAVMERLGNPVPGQIIPPFLGSGDNLLRAICDGFAKVLGDESR